MRSCLPHNHPPADRDSQTLAEPADLPVIGFSPQVNPQWRDFRAVDPRPGIRHLAVTDLAPCAAVLARPAGRPKKIVRNFQGRCRSRRRVFVA